MNLEEAIEGLEKLVAEVRQTSLADDKTPLGSALALRQEGRLINEGKSEFSVVVFGDLNDFKHLNDLHGHAAGDVAINKVGETLRHFIIKNLGGKAFRQSGDEFVILLKESQLEGFLSLVPFILNIMFSYNRKPLQTQLSLGYVVSDRKSSFEDLLGRAEVACQVAKAKGEGGCMEWTTSIYHNPIVRISGRCRNCDSRISCNVPKNNAPLTLTYCPCCGQRL